MYAAWWPKSPATPALFSVYRSSAPGESRKAMPVPVQVEWAELFSRTLVSKGVTE